MKKHTLFKMIGIIILVYCILTWFVPASYYSGGLQELGTYPIGLFNIINIPFQTLGYFSSVFVFILVVGALYGVLEATGLYRKTLDNLAKKMKNHKQIWLIVLTVVLAILSSVVGLEIGMFVIFPFIISLIILLGYDKKTALLATLGSTIVGMIGSTYSYTMYGINNSILGLDYNASIWVKLILLVLSLGLLIAYMLLYNRKNNDKKEDKKLDSFVPVTKEARKVGCKKTWPIILVLSLCFVILLLGSFDFAGALGFTWFSDIYDKLIAVEISEYPLFNNLLGGFSAFGTWNGPSRYIYYIGTILIGTIALAIIYKINFNDYLKAMFKGGKENIEPAALTVLANSVLIIVSSFPIFLTIAEFITNGKFNIATLGLTNMLGSSLYVDMYYYPQYVLEYFTTLANVDISILNVLLVSLYSVVMLVVPTSLLLVTTLSKTETKYFDWLKFIWKLFLGIVVVVFIVLTIAFII